MNFSNDIKIKEKFYAHVLQEQFLKRMKRSSSYSLRKFALEVGIEVSVLSKYFRQKRKITLKSFNRIVENLNLDSKKLKYIEESFFRSLSGLELLPVDYEDILSDWHAFVILECLNLDRKIQSSAELSQITGIDYRKVQKLVNRLVEIGGIDFSENGWKDNFENITFVTHEDMDTTIGRHFQNGLIEKVKESINHGCEKKKSHTSMIMAFDEGLLPTVKEKIRDFRRELCVFLEENQKNRNNVYCLQINLNPLLTKDIEMETSL